MAELNLVTSPPVTPPPVVVPPPVVTPPPATGGQGCGEFTPLGMGIAWPTDRNSIKRAASGWTADRALVVRFSAGTTIGDMASFQFSHTGPPYQNMVASVSNASGCNVCRTYPPQAPILAASSGGTPIFRFIVGASRVGWITVQPGADYWITAVWRNGFGAQFTPSILDDADGGAGVRLDFNT